MNTGKAIRGALSYNEEKVRLGKAELLLASGFSCDISDLNFSEKLARFRRLIDRNPEIQTNTMHLSLNFAPGEILDSETVQRIAVDYMGRIGFGRQPFLVYQHNDSFHPHIHIVTTTIKENGKSIYLHNIGREKSEPARKAIEIEYNLIKAEDRNQKVHPGEHLDELKPAVYSEEGTKTQISNIVRKITSTYKFSSLEELNAALRKFNVIADPGPEGSKMNQNAGLVYNVIDKDGFKIGVPVKASSIYTRPTLSNLQTKFEQNQIKKERYQILVKNKVATALAKSHNPEQFNAQLQRRNIYLNTTRDIRGNIETINFVDHVSKSVFNHMDLGFTVQMILTQLKQKSNALATKVSKRSKTHLSQQSASIRTLPATTNFLSEITKQLFSVQTDQSAPPGESPKKRRKKKKR